MTHIHTIAADGKPTNTQSKKTKEIRGLRRIQWKIRVFAKSETLSNIILFAIGVNLGFMAVDHNCDFCDMSFKCGTFKGVLESSNLGFAAIFLAEMLIKLVGIGPMNYLRGPMNWVDGFVVVTSLLEIPGVVQTYECYFEPKDVCEKWYVCDEGAAELTILRTFR